ncbi:hypothetical protein Tco_1352847 [Tanacetum coccineum]
MRVRVSLVTKWSLDDLKFSVTKSGPYQTDPPCLEEIKSYIQEERASPVTRVCHKAIVDVESLELYNESYFLYDRVIYPLTAQQERKTRKDYGRIRGRHSTSSSSAFVQQSSSYLNDDDDDGNDEGTSHASTPSPTHFFNSLINEVPRVFENQPNIDPNMEIFYTRQTEILNHSV